ncbi:MAG: hypothetical protein K6E78_10400 [Treponema sp.]|nr:hypothetical protein [Treponema sp.]
MKIFRALFCLVILAAFSIFPLSAELCFNGLAGARAAFDSDKTSSEFDPQMKMQSFFAGQLNISDNFILHGEFSIKTDDLIENSIFNETPATFQVDELSAIYRKTFAGTTSYFSAFVGTYEPIGSDIFLRRHFGIQPISSIITESWLGIAGSVIYPLFGAGLSDVIHFSSQPIAAGLYGYVNHELDDSFVLNFDGRFACVYRYLTLDFATGIGSPLNTKEYDDAFLVIDTLYWRAGMNLLFGNMYTTSLFIQAGLSEVPFKKSDQSLSFREMKTYLLVEPRLNLSKCRIDLSAFSLPEESVEDFIFIDDTLGASINIHSDDLYIKDQNFTLGVQSSLSFPGKYFYDLQNIADFFSEGYTVCFTPYFQTKIFSGELHTLIKCRITDFMNDKWYNAFNLSIGYKAQF